MPVDSPVISEPIGTRPVENVVVREEPIVPITQQPKKHTPEGTHYSLVD